PRSISGAPPADWPPAWPPPAPPAPPPPPAPPAPPPPPPPGSLPGPAPGPTAATGDIERTRAIRAADQQDGRPSHRRAPVIQRFMTRLRVGAYNRAAPAGNNTSPAEAQDDKLYAQSAPPASPGEPDSPT